MNSTYPWIEAVSTTRDSPAGPPQQLRQLGDIRHDDVSSVVTKLTKPGRLRRQRNPRIEDWRVITQFVFDVSSVLNCSQQ
jgi:hypothetical protein